MQLNLDNQGLVMIDGNNQSADSFTTNGVGKSSSVSAIVYGLYGLTICHVLYYFVRVLALIHISRNGHKPMADSKSRQRSLRVVW